MCERLPSISCSCRSIFRSSYQRIDNQHLGPGGAVDLSRYSLPLERNRGVLRDASTERLECTDRKGKPHRRVLKIYLTVVGFLFFDVSTQMRQRFSPASI